MQVLAWILARTPLPVAAGFARLVSWLWWFVVPVRRALAARNFRAAFPGSDPGPALRRMMRGLVLGYCEFFREAHRPGTVVLDLQGVELVRERFRRGEGTLLLSGHLGSWDLVGPMAARQAGFPLTSLVKSPHARGVAELTERVRREFGLGLLGARKGAISRVFRLLAEGQTVVFLLDQNEPGGIAAPFFGRPALTAASLAVAAARTRLPVFFIEFWRERTGRHGARITGPLPTTGRVAEDTAAFARCIEEAVRRRPHNWLWLHNRWKGVPAGG